MYGWVVMLGGKSGMCAQPHTFPYRSRMPWDLQRFSTPTLPKPAAKLSKCCMHSALAASDTSLIKTSLTETWTERIK